MKCTVSCGRIIRNRSWWLRASVLVTRTSSGSLIGKKSAEVVKEVDVGGLDLGGDRNRRTAVLEALTHPEDRGDRVAALHPTQRVQVGRLDIRAADHEQRRSADVLGRGERRAGEDVAVAVRDPVPGHLRGGSRSARPGTRRRRTRRRFAPPRSRSWRDHGGEILVDRGDLRARRRAEDGCRLLAALLPALAQLHAEETGVRPEGCDRSGDLTAKRSGGGRSGLHVGAPMMTWESTVGASVIMPRCHRFASTDRSRTTNRWPGPSLPLETRTFEGAQRRGVVRVHQGLEGSDLRVGLHLDQEGPRASPYRRPCRDAAGATAIDTVPVASSRSTRTWPTGSLRLLGDPQPRGLYRQAGAASQLACARGCDRPAAEAEAHRVRVVAPFEQQGRVGRAWPDGG